MDAQTIWLAGGCFWGMEKLMSSVPGVRDVVSGYANGRVDTAPTYSEVCTGTTGCRETVRVSYDAEQVSLDALLYLYFEAVDPTTDARQGADVGDQYSTGIYYADEESRAIAERIVERLRPLYSAFYVELAPLEHFWPAEEYHQDYLDKNPNGYCHIPLDLIRRAASLLIDPGDYPRPGDAAIRELLTDEQYKVTQENGTEMPFDNEYWDNFQRGIYVDRVSGEPLFYSSDKYESSCGWASFADVIDPGVVVFSEDTSHNMDRTEVRGRTSDSHLGHVFENDAESPTGTRYCINSAALRFIPYSQMEAAGYGALMPYVK